MKKQIKIDTKGLIAVYDYEEENSLYFVGEEANKIILEFRKKYNDNRDLYPKDEFINAHPIKELENSTHGGATHEIEINKTKLLPVFRVKYAWGKFEN